MREFFHSFIRICRRYYFHKIFLLTISLFVLSFFLYFAWIAHKTNVEALEDGLAQATVIYDQNGEEASKVTALRAEAVPLEEISPYVIDAIIAIEDQHFYEHKGFDIKGIGRAFLANIKAGKITEGGSTITQQLTKIAFLSPERTYRRKIEELFLAAKIEKTYTKKEILEMYVNQIYFGSGAWGVENASLKYFGKNVSDISLSEAALLAGIIKRPSALNPYENFEAALNRRNLVLDQMHDLGMISAEEKENAKNEEIILKDGGGDLLKGKYPYYVDAVINEAIELYGYTQEELLTKGYEIYTHLDQNLQMALESVYRESSLFPDHPDGTLVQSGTVLLDPHTGGIRALVGGRGAHTFRGFNRATQLQAQPGSVLKPIVVYTPALEKGYTPYSILKDQKNLSFAGYKPKNANRTYFGELPMYRAIEYSVNVPAVWLLNEMGVQTGIDALKRFGLPVQEEEHHLALALGGTKTGYSPKQLAEAYAVFANGGNRVKSHLITKIIGPTGKVEVEVIPQKIQITSKNITEQMTAMLLNVVESGTGRRAFIKGYTVAGKTGSTQFKNGVKDQWFIGYTPNIVGAIWIGFDYTNDTYYLKGNSSNVVVPIFREIMKNVLPYVEKENFKVQSINEQLKNKSEKEEVVKRNKPKKQKKHQHIFENNNEDIDKKIKEKIDQLNETFEQQKGNWEKIEEDLMRKFENFE